MGRAGTADFGELFFFRLKWSKILPLYYNHFDIGKSFFGSLPIYGTEKSEPGMAVYFGFCFGSLCRVGHCALFVNTGLPDECACSNASFVEKKVRYDGGTSSFPYVKSCSCLDLPSFKNLEGLRLNRNK